MNNVFTQQLTASRKELQHLVAQYPRHTLIYVGPPEWHINDIMVNIAFWEYEGAKSVNAFLAGSTYVPANFSEERVDSINATIYAEMHDADDALIDEYASTCRNYLVDALQRVPIQDVQNSMLCPWNQYHSVVDFVAGMIAHEQEHIRDMYKVLGRIPH